MSISSSWDFNWATTSSGNYGGLCYWQKQEDLIGNVCVQQCAGYWIKPGCKNVWAVANNGKY